MRGKKKAILFEETESKHPRGGDTSEEAQTGRISASNLENG